MKVPGPRGQNNQRAFSWKRFAVLFALFSLSIFAGILVLYAQRSGVVQRSLYEGSRELLALQRAQSGFERAEDIQRQYDLESGVTRQTMLIEPSSSKVLYNTKGTGHGYPDNTGVLMKDKHPDAWAAMSSSGGAGMFLSHEGLYVFDNIAAFDRETRTPSPIFYKVAVFISTETLSGEYYRVQMSFFLPFIALMVLAALAAWPLARTWARKQENQSS